MDQELIQQRMTIVDKQLFKVTKSNELIQKSKIGMTLQEQKIIAFIISRINVNDTDPNKYYIFNTKEFCQVCEINPKNYIHVRKTLKKLYDRESIEIFEDGYYVPLKWLGDYKLEPDASKVSIQLHFRIVPYLVELKKNFTTYCLHNVLFLRNKYSISLYELFLSYSFKEKLEISICELKSYLNISNDEYKELKIFKRAVINKCLIEINDITNLRVKCMNIKTGRKITGFIFIIKKIS